ncbi:MAG: phosphoribosyl-ATP pyrophosphohydrolase [Dasania sp.]|jgi:phosphoribosyl-ATP pyrophosphohydrolase
MMHNITLLNELLETIHARKNDSVDTSYTAKLLSKGLPKITQKVGEEATEIVIAALVESKADCIGEIADFLYHLSVLMAVKDISWNEIATKLHERMNMSGLEEKSARKFKS